MKYLLIYRTISSGEEYKIFESESDLVSFCEKQLTTAEDFDILLVFRGLEIKVEATEKIKSIKLI